MKFFEPELEEPAPEGLVDMIRSWIDDPTFRYLLQMGLATFLVLLTLFMVVRPALRFYMAGDANFRSAIELEAKDEITAKLNTGEVADSADIRAITATLVVDSDNIKSLTTQVANLSQQGDLATITGTAAWYAPYNLKINEIDFSNWKGELNTIQERVDGQRQIWIQDPQGYWIEINDIHSKPSL